MSGIDWGILSELFESFKTLFCCCSILEESCRKERERKQKGGEVGVKSMEYLGVKETTFSKLFFGVRRELIFDFLR